MKLALALLLAWMGIAARRGKNRTFFCVSAFLLIVVVAMKERKMCVFPTD